MTVAQPATSRKALYIPFALALIAVIALSFGWFRLRDAAETRMDAAVTELRAEGYALSWDERSFGGFPFRLDVNLTGFRIAEPSGWAVEAPRLRAEAFVYSSGHWVAVAPDGAVLQRPQGGPLAIEGKALRASLADLDDHTPRVAVEGADLTFSPGDGASDFPIRSLKRLNLHLRPGPDDQAAVLFRADEARADLPGMLGALGRDRPVTINIELIFSQMSAMRGDGWEAMARDWSASGGEMTVQNASLETGGGVLAAHGGPLRIDPDGRVSGDLTLDLERAGEALSDMTGGLLPPGAGFGGANLRLEDGRTHLGPFEIAPAPKAY